MIVVSNTTPINFLLLIDALHVLPALYGRIERPEAVHRELSASGAPDVVQAWTSRLPDWARIHRVDMVDTSLRLHSGVAEAIAVAALRHADLVLLDDRSARTVAKSRGMAVTGTLGILAVAAERRLVDLSDVVERLKATSFQAHRYLYDTLLERVDSSLREAAQEEHRTP